MIEPSWTVILAAGQGRRLASLTGGIPKQFWRGQGSSSLLDDTLARVAPLAPLSRTVVIVDQLHRRHVQDHRVSASPATIIYQPEDRGTAAGVLLALTPILRVNPDALVMITPSDHGVVDTEGFRAGIREAARHAVRRAAVVLLGVEPTAAHRDYGWIMPGPSPDSASLRAVQFFVEKPSAEVASGLWADGAVWNTMVLVARASAIRDLCFSLLPQLREVFETAARLPADERPGFLNAVYATLPAFDFSRHVLTPAPDLWTYVWPASIGWSDLGTPERLAAWHQRAGMSPAMTAA